MVLKEVLRVLKPSGRLLIDITDGCYMKENFSPRSWEWIDKNYFVCRERSLSENSDRLISREVISHVKKGVIADQFYAERLYSRETISSLLGKVGLKEITFHSMLTTDSQRNQDLGMMERRIVVTSRAFKEWTPVQERKTGKKKVAVLLGDPRKSDTVKPSGVFEESDFKTISELKNALDKLDDYKFSYFDNHETIINDLVKNRDKFDFFFNLCDEASIMIPDRSFIYLHSLRCWEYTTQAGALSVLSTVMINLW